MLSNGYSFRVNNISGSLAVAPCCLFKKAIPVTSDLLSQRTLHFSNINTWTNDCRECYVLEQSGQPSLRQSGPDWISDSVDSQSAVMIDVNLDRQCNAACVICGEHSSTLWEQENRKMLKISSSVTKSDSHAQQHIQSIIDTVNLDQVTYVKFFGGEPLFTDTHLHFLEKLPNPHKITVHYTTNGSIYPNKKVLDTWSKFKTIIFAASIDGVGRQFDYIRWPLPWSKVSQNLTRLKDHGLHNVLFRIEFTANLLNTYYYNLLDEWVAQNWSANLFGDPTEINIHQCSRSAFAFENMPFRLRSLIMEKYPESHILHRMTKKLGEQTDLNEFFNFVDRWDVHRHVFWQECFPDLIDFVVSNGR